MLDAKYRPLKEYVCRKGGLRLAIHGGFRDQLVEMAVVEFPLDAQPDKRVEVLAARLRRRAAKQYGSIMLMVLVSVLSNLIAKLVVEWWQRNHSHKVLMHGWNYAAQNPNLPS